MFCPKCGVEVGETDNYCYNCGHKLDFKRKSVSKAVKLGKNDKKSKKKKNRRR